MKKLQYTLVEILVSMAIFVIMMGILMKTFSVGADVVSSETIKVNILTDANVFYSYLTKDFRGVAASPLTPPSYIGVGNTEISNRNPDKTAIALEQYGLSIILRATTANTPDSIEIYTDAKPYGSDMQLALDNNPDYELLLRYQFDSNKIYRNQYIIDTSQSDYDIDQITNNSAIGVNSHTGGTDINGNPSNSNDNAVILEGVEDFEMVLWEDYEGGTKITTTISANSFTKLEKIPACITFYLTLNPPNPDAADEIKQRYRRTISKTVYLN
jgi:hypothetical protein